MFLKPIQSKNIIIEDTEGQPYQMCVNCYPIEESFSKGILPKNILYNGWGFAQHRLGAQSLHGTTNISSFLDEILMDEIRSTFWCKTCASLSFTRVFSSINDGKINIGFSTLENESSIDNIEISMFRDYRLNLTSDCGKFIVYNDSVTEYNIVKISATEATISNANGKFGTITFDQAEKKLKFNFENKSNVKSDKIVSYIFKCGLENTTLTTEDLRDYDLIKAKIKFTDGEVNNYTGCYIISYNDV